MEHKLVGESQRAALQKRRLVGTDVDTAKISPPDARSQEHPLDPDATCAQDHALSACEDRVQEGPDQDPPHDAPL